MKLKELFDKFTDDEIIKQSIELYDGDCSELNLAALAIIRSLVVTESDMVVTVEWVSRKDYPKDWPDSMCDEYWHVGGVVDGENYAIEFTPWQEWLGSPFKTKTTDLDTVCHCLWEMTFMGLPEEIEEKKNMLDQRMADYDSGKTKAIPIEDLLN